MIIVSLEMNKLTVSVKNGIHTFLISGNTFCNTLLISKSYRVTGVHLLDSMEDGTEIVDPLLTDEFDNGATKNDQPVTLCIKGCSLIPLPSPNITTGSPPNDNPGLHYEEIISSDGVVEEYFAYSDE